MRTSPLSRNRVSIAPVDRLEGGREPVEALSPLTTLFTRRDFLPDK